MKEELLSHNVLHQNRAGLVSPLTRDVLPLARAGTQEEVVLGGGGMGDGMGGGGEGWVMAWGEGEGGGRGG